MRRHAFLLLLPVGMAGCAPTFLSDAKLQSSTASVIGAPESAIAISGRHDDGMTNTYYTATANGRTYSCSINGGSPLDAGLTTPPVCNAR